MTDRKKLPTEAREAIYCVMRGAGSTLRDALGAVDDIEEIVTAALASLPSERPEAEDAKRANLNDLHQGAANRLADLLDIYDDYKNNAPEHRCYVESAWDDVLADSRLVIKEIDALAASQGAKE